MNKTLQDFGISEGDQDVNVFMYVIHTKKAQVPNEVARIRQQQQQQDMVKCRKINQRLQVCVHDCRVQNFFFAVTMNRSTM